MYFTRTRNVELSVIQGIEDAVNNSWTGIPVLKAFLKAYSTQLPCICVRMLSVDSFRKEIGANTLRQQYLFSVDIFAKSDGQRLDLADFITNTVKEGFIYYEYSHSSGNAEQLTRETDGRIIFLSFINNERVDFSDDVEEHDRFRHSISFSVEK